MKTQRGVTLTSLIIYIIGMVMIISIVSVLTTYFYKNVRSAISDIDPITEHTKFNSYFTNEVNKEKIKILECSNNGGQNYIVFDNGTQYTFVEANKGIYINNVKICKQVTECTFTQSIENGNDVVIVVMKISGEYYTNKYTLKK